MGRSVLYDGVGYVLDLNIKIFVSHRFQAGAGAITTQGNSSICSSNLNASGASFT